MEISTTNAQQCKVQVVKQLTDSPVEILRMICKEFAILTGIILTENDENALCVDELTHSLEYTCRKIMPLAQQARLQHAQHIDATQVYDMSLGRLSDFVLGCQEWMFTPDKIRIIRTEREVERHELFTASNEENGYLMRYVLRGWQHMLSLRSGVGSYLSRYSELADQLEHRATSQAGVVVSSTAECEFLILGNQASAPQVWYVMAVKRSVYEVSLSGGPHTVKHEFVGTDGSVLWTKSLTVSRDVVRRLRNVLLCHSYPSDNTVSMDDPAH